MDVQELAKPVEPEKKQRSGWLVAAVAFAVVILFVGAAMLLARPAAELPPVTTPPTTQAVTPTTEAAPPTTGAAEEGAAPTTVATVEEVATDALSVEQQEFVDAFFAAFNAGTYTSYPGDYESYLGFFAPDATINTSILFDGGLERYREELAFRGAMNHQLTVVSCREEFGSIRCQVDATSDDMNHYTDSVRIGVSMIVKNGAIVSMTWSENLAEIGRAATPFYEWISDNHPGTLRLMRSNSGSPGPPLLTEESIALWLELLPQYKATLDG